MKTYQTDVCIVGGGPAGLFMGLALAKQGVKVLVVETHPTFDREFRGEILQTRFVQIMKQIKLLDYLEQQVHLRLDAHDYYFNTEEIAHVEFQDMNPEASYAIWMPQPVMLQALLDKAKTYPSFEMWFDAGVKRLVQEEDDACVGVVLEQNGEEIEVRAKVTVGADGRFSTVRRLGHFEMEYEYHEQDYIWFTAKRPNDWPNSISLIASESRNYIIFPRVPDGVQAGITMPKGRWKDIQERGIEPLRAELREASRVFEDFASDLEDFKPFHILQARLHFVQEWAKNGLLLIGDAAHCAAPAGAVGVALSVATALVAANVVCDALAEGDVSAARLRQVQELRSEEVRKIHQTQMNPRGGRTTDAMKSEAFRESLKKRFVMEKPLPIDERFVF